MDDWENPFRGNSPLFEDEKSEEMFVDAVLYGRSLLHYYEGAIIACMLASAIVHWTTKARTGDDKQRTADQGSEAQEQSPLLDASSPTNSGRTGYVQQAKRKIIRWLRRLRASAEYQPDSFDESTGVTVFCTVYCLITVWFLCWRVTDFHPIVIGYRVGYVTLVNMAAAFLLGVKYTPLTWITGWSYESLNVFHRMCGHICYYTLIIHAIVFVYYFRLIYMIWHLWSLAGIIAGTTMLTIVLTSHPAIRAKMYEFFYVLHIVGSVVCVPMVFIHYPTCRPHAALCGLALVYDRTYRVLRAVRVLECEYRAAEGETVILRIKNRGGTLFRRKFYWEPGHHAFVTLLGCCPWQSHPYTIASYMHGRSPQDGLGDGGNGPDSTDPVQRLEDEEGDDVVLIIRAREGFSRKLFNKCKDQSDPVRDVCIMHGPYGIPCLPSSSSDPGKSQTQWSLVKEQPSLQSLLQSAGLTTGQGSSEQSSSRFLSDVAESVASADACESDSGVRTPTLGRSGTPMPRPPLRSACETKVILVSGGSGVAYTYPLFAQCLANDLPVSFVWIIPRRGFTSWIETHDDMNIWVTAERGRPDISELVRSEVQGYSKYVIATCGPDHLLRSVRNVSSKLVEESRGALNLSLFAEKFGW